MIPREIEVSLASHFKTTLSGNFVIISSHLLSGGSINNVYRIRTSEGNYCLKYNDRASFPGMFEKEKAGLEILGKAGEIRVPGVITTGESGKYSYILLEFVDPVQRIPGFMADFGSSLACLHRHSADYFGLDHDNFMGSLPQSNARHPGWGSFFATERIGKQLAIAEKSRYFSKPDLEAFDRLAGQADEIFPEEKPSLLHGDLWGGNYIVSEKGKACLIDPAVYYGHREVDIAMTRLFGGFEPAFYSAYNEAFPMEPGWEERLDIYNLYPLLIHLNLFGQGYLEQVLRIVRKF
jgi:protein-ribulosamine 3-kinase